MNTSFRSLRIAAALALLSAGTLAATPAHASGAVLGAVIGGGAGAVIGQSIGGHDGAIIGGALGAAVGVAAARSQHDRGYGYGGQVVAYPGPVYAPAPVYAPPPVYLAPPVYRARPRVVYQTPPRVVHVPVRYVSRPYVHGPGAYAYGHDRGDRFDARFRR